MMLPTLVEIPSAQAKPFLKWAGGKTQLIRQMSSNFPNDLRDGKISKYVEPFVGSGAVFFHIAQSYHISEFYISDINPEVIVAYTTIQKDVESLIQELSQLEKKYLGLTPAGQEKRFYEIRKLFNTTLRQFDYLRFNDEWIERAAQLIFLNHTCFNGLFRVNPRKEFNVPFGRYKKPLISAPANLRAVSQVLQRTKISSGDFTNCDAYVDSSTFVYLDPPYRPISRTASFTSYASNGFDDSEQLRLSNFYRALDKKGARLMLSNSDPKNEDVNDDFFERAYEGFNIVRVMASRMINSNASKRGKIKELLILNYGGDR